MRIFFYSSVREARLLGERSIEHSVGHRVRELERVNLLQKSACKNTPLRNLKEARCMVPTFRVPTFRVSTFRGLTSWCQHFECYHSEC